MANPQEAIAAHLSALREEAGSPSLRALAAQAGGAVSETTIGEVLKGSRIPTWKKLEPVVKALGGDPDEVHPIWLLCQEPGAEQAKPPRKRSEAVTDGPWYVVENDVIGGWSISTAVTPVSMGRGVVIADFMRRVDAELCVRARNNVAAGATPEIVRSAPTSQLRVAEDGALHLK